MNGKYVWETAKRVCEYINTHEELIHITTFQEYRDVMRKVVVIKEAHNLERKRRHTLRKKKDDEAKERTQKDKALVARIKGGDLRKEEIMVMLEKIFGKGSRQEIDKASTKGEITERIEEMSRRDKQFDTREKTRLETKRRREDRRLNLF